MSASNDSNFLETHPELIMRRPRVGGGMISYNEFIDSFKEKQSTKEKHPRHKVDASTSKELKFHSIMDETLWNFSEASLAPSPQQDATDLISVVITTILFMSAEKYDALSDMHLKWTYKYLSCIKDENGQTPPNIRGILNLYHTHLPEKLPTICD